MYLNRLWKSQIVQINEDAFVVNISQVLDACQLDNIVMPHAERACDTAVIIHIVLLEFGMYCGDFAFLDGKFQVVPFERLVR